MFLKLTLKLLLVSGLMLACVSHAQAPLSVKPMSFESDIAWLDFTLPNVQIKTEGEVSHEIWQALNVPLIKQICFNVARLLYQQQVNAPKLPSLEIILSSFDGVAFKDGDFNGATIKVSVDYLNKYAKNNDKQALEQELVGILYHEIAHAYQLDDHNYGEIGPVIEGIADVVRMQAGYVDFSHRKAGGNFDSGYKTTAFYLDWLIKNKPEVTLSTINAQLNPHDEIKWSWQTFALLNELDLSQSWQLYQNSL